jgi:ribosome-associated translation inhibitor RaiA
MKLNLQHLNLRPLDKLDSWIENQIQALGQMRVIEAANVRLARLGNASPAYQVRVQLVTPGPDVFAESRDHTLRAAFAKAITQLRSQIASRAQKRATRWRNKLSLRAAR